MRTTIDLPDTLFKKMKAMAALKGMKMKEYVTDVLEKALATSKQTHLGKKRHEVKFPLIHRKKPGTIRYSNEQLEDLMIAEEVAKLEKLARR